jgi:hypothetical protein
VFEGELDRVRINGFHRLNDAVIGGIERLLLWIHDALIIPAHHLGIEIRAIVELHPLAQVKQVDFAVLQDLPGLSQVWDIVQLCIDGNQAVEQVAHGAIGLDTSREMGIQPGDIRFPRDLQCTSGLGLLSPDCQWYQQEHSGYRQHQPAAALVSLHELPLLTVVPTHRHKPAGGAPYARMHRFETAAVGMETGIGCHRQPAPADA